MADPRSNALRRFAFSGMATESDLPRLYTGGQLPAGPGGLAGQGGGAAMPGAQDGGAGGGLSLANLRPDAFGRVPADQQGTFLPGYGTLTPEQQTFLEAYRSGSAGDVRDGGDPAGINSNSSLAPGGFVDARLLGLMGIAVPGVIGTAASIGGLAAKNNNLNYLDDLRGYLGMDPLTAGDRLSGLFNPFDNSASGYRGGWESLYEDMPDFQAPTHGVDQNTIKAQQVYQDLRNAGRGNMPGRTIGRAEERELINSGWQSSSYGSSDRGDVGRDRGGFGGGLGGTTGQGGVEGRQERGGRSTR